MKNYVVMDLEATCWEAKEPEPGPPEIIEIGAVRLNLKRQFARTKRTRPCGMREALRHLGLPLVGTHHRAIDDARNIVSIGRVILS